MQRTIQLLFIIISVFFMEAASYSKCPYPEKIYPCVCVDNNGYSKVTCEGDKLEMAKNIKLFNKMASYFAKFQIKSSNLQVLPNLLFVMERLVLITPSLRVISNDALRFTEKSLKVLYLEYCNLTSILDIHPVIKYAFVLEKLAVQRSPIEKIESDAFTNTVHIQNTLRVLDLCYNRINHIGDDAFSSLKRLTWLYLHDNNIKEISVAAFPSSYMNPYLKYIYLWNNKFNTLNYLLIKELNRGVEMNMFINNITTISLEDLRLIVQSGVKINLIGNPIICDQNFKVIALMNSIQHRHNLIGQCFSPESLKGVEFSDLKPENFTN